MEVDELKVSSSTQARASLLREMIDTRCVVLSCFIRPIWTTHELCPTKATDKLMILSNLHTIVRRVTLIQY